MAISITLFGQMAFRRFLGLFALNNIATKPFVTLAIMCPPFVKIFWIRALVSLAAYADINVV
jgi:hypothetical protein